MLKKILRISGIALLSLGILSVSFFGVVYAKSEEIGADVVLTEEGLSTIYTPSPVGYRYGPSIIRTGENRYEALFSTNPSAYKSVCPDIGPSCADVLTYRVSEDGGKTWSEEVLSLIPEENSPDRFSVCDPSFIKVGEWYYAAYTSTFDATSAGVYNHIYAARTKTPADYKSWEKWNGSDWSQFGSNDYKPIVEYTCSALHYGIGEPSMVLVDDEIYVYYTYDGPDAQGNTRHQTRLAKGKFSEKFPLDLKDYSVVVDRDPSEDALDVKFVDDWNVFLAVNTYNRFTQSSRIKFQISEDGINFREVNTDSSKSIPRLHNSGMSGDQTGHLQLDQSLFVIYAYAKSGKDWGKWSTAVQFYTIEKTCTRKFGKMFEKSVEDTKVKDGTKAWAGSNINEIEPSVENLFSPECAVDGDTTTFYYSVTHPVATYNEFLAVKVNRTVNSVTLTPCEDGIGFPAVFRFQMSNDSVHWTDIEGSEYSFKDSPVTDAEPVTLSLGQKVKAKYIRLIASELTEYQDLYSLQLAEISFA